MLTDFCWFLWLSWKSWQWKSHYTWTSPCNFIFRLEWNSVSCLHITLFRKFYV